MFCVYWWMFVCAHVSEHAYACTCVSACWCAGMYVYMCLCVIQMRLLTKDNIRRAGTCSNQIKTQTSKSIHKAASCETASFCSLIDTEFKSATWGDRFGYDFEMCACLLSLETKRHFKSQTQHIDHDTSSILSQASAS